VIREPRTMFRKVWDAHAIIELEDGDWLLLGLDEIQGTVEYLSVMESWEASRNSSYKEIPRVPDAGRTTVR
jgi:hypothetical protein